MWCWSCWAQWCWACWAWWWWTWRVWRGWRMTRLLLSWEVVYTICIVYSVYWEGVWTIHPQLPLRVKTLLNLLQMIATMATAKMIPMKEAVTKKTTIRRICSSTSESDFENVPSPSEWLSISKPIQFNWALEWISITGPFHFNWAVSRGRSVFW